MRDVVVIGAGLAGSGIAAALAQQGWDVLLIERDSFPRHKVCGEFLSPEAQASLHALGLYEAVAALDPCPVTNVRLVTQNGAVVEATLPGKAWGLSRYAMDGALATAAQMHGAELWTNMAVKRYMPEGDGFIVQLRDGAAQRSVQTRAVIAACGRHTQTGLPPKPRALDRRKQAVGVKCHYDQISMPAQVELFMFPGGYAGVNAVEGGRINVCLLAAYDAFAQAGKNVESMIATAAAANPGLAQRLAGGRALAETAVAVAPVDTGRPPAPWDGIACVGDTAAMIPPLCGDGMAMALRSAQLCAPFAHDYLRGTLSLAAWQTKYSDLWHAEFNARLRTGRWLQSLLNRPVAAELLVKAGQAMPALATYMVQATRG